MFLNDTLIRYWFPGMKVSSYPGILLLVPGAFEVMDSAGTCRVEFAMISGVSAQSGVNKPDQVFSCMSLVQKEAPSHGCRFSGWILELSTLPEVPISAKQFLLQSAGGFGRLRQYNADSFAAHLLDIPVLVDSKLDAVRLTAHFVEYEDLTPARVKVQCLETPDQGLVATTACEFGHDESGRGSEPIADIDRSGNSAGSKTTHSANAAKASGSSGRQAPSGDLLDLLADAVTDDMPPKKRKTAKVSADKKISSPMIWESEEVDGANSKRVDILDDASLQTFLSEQEISALKEARNICQESAPASTVQEWRSRKNPDEVLSESEQEEEEVVDFEIDPLESTHGGATAELVFYYINRFPLSRFPLISHIIRVRDTVPFILYIYNL